MKRLSYLLTASLCFLTCSLKGQNCQSIADGNFFDPAIWSTGVVPTSVDSLLIYHQVTGYAPINIHASFFHLMPSGYVMADNLSSGGDSLSIEADKIIIDGPMWGMDLNLNATSGIENEGHLYAFNTMKLTSFTNYGVIHSSDSISFSGTPAAANYFALTGKYDLEWTGSLYNFPGGSIGSDGDIVTGDSLFNYGSIGCDGFVHAGYSDGDSSGSLCVWNSFANTGIITGTQGICDNTPGSFGDVSTGVFGPDLVYCADPWCFTVGRIAPEIFSISISPSPADEWVTLHFSSVTNGELEIMNLEGKSFQHTVFSGKQQLDLDVSTLPAGLYFVRVESQQGSVVKKMVVR